MKVQVISRETIVPSSPTPPHLQTFKTSIIDKILPYVYTQFISFYVPNQNYTKHKSIQHLKQTLSKSLTIFYPFAGRVKDDLTVDCNDNGVLFTTAQVSCKMGDLLTNPQPKIELFDKFSPPMPPFCPGMKDRPAQIAIQTNEFDCGGIAICFCFSHFIIDAVTIGMFLKCWSQIACRNEGAMSSSIYPAVSMFPQGSEDSMPDGLSAGIEFSLLREGRGTTKRFVFDGKAISALKEKTKSELVPNPTRVEAVSAFTWKHLMAASEVVWGSKQPSILIQAADLRRRMAPTAFSELSVGNIIWKSIAHYKNTSMDTEVEKQLVGLEREAIEKIKDEFVPKLLNNGAYETICESLEALKETCSDKSLNPYTISSWCKMGLNEIDFGWGNPIWVSLIPGLDVLYKNVAVLIDGETNDKIEAWISLDNREMRVLEGDHEFLVFATINPPISY